MKAEIKNPLWHQLGAAIDMLENAISMCPDTQWDTGTKFWYNVYHCLFYLDYYLDLHPDSFAPPAPFSLSEFDPSGTMPERTYTKDELLVYVKHCRAKAVALLSGFNEDLAQKRWVNAYRDYSITEIIIYNMRHVQHHVGQLNLLLRQSTGNAPQWVSSSKLSLD